MQRMPGPKGPRTVIPPVTLTPDELAEVDRRAKAAKMPRAEYVRRRALGEACAPRFPRVTVQG